MPSKAAQTKRRADRAAARSALCAPQDATPLESGAATHSSAPRDDTACDSRVKPTMPITGEAGDWSNDKHSMQRPHGGEMPPHQQHSQQAAAHCAGPESDSHQDCASRVGPTIPTTGEEGDWSKQAEQDMLSTNEPASSTGNSASATLQYETAEGSKVWNIPASWTREEKLRWKAMQEVCDAHGLTAPPSSGMKRFPVGGDNLRMVMDSLVSMYIELVDTTYRRLDVAQKKRDTRRDKRRAKHAAVQEKYHGVSPLSKQEK